MQNTDKIFYEIQEKACLLHLVAMGELDRKAKSIDAQRWFWALSENCENCKYKDNCLCYLYTKGAML